MAANAGGLSTLSHLVIVSALLALALVFATCSLLVDDERGHGDAAVHSSEIAAGRPRLAPVVLLVFAGMLAIVTEVTGGDWASFRMTDDFAAAASLGSLAFVAYTVGMTSVRFGGDWPELRLRHVGLHRLAVATAATGLVLAALVPSRAASIAGFLLVGMGIATFMPRIYDNAARLPGRRGAGMAAMTGGTALPSLVTPVVVGGLAGTSLSVGGAIVIVSLPAVIGLAVVTEWSERPLRRSRMMSSRNLHEDVENPRSAPSSR